VEVWQGGLEGVLGGRRAWGSGGDVVEGRGWKEGGGKYGGGGSMGVVWNRRIFYKRTPLALKQT